MLKLGDLKFIYTRLQSYMAPIASFMLVDLWIVKYGFQWWYAFPAVLFIAAILWFLIDKPYVGPKEAQRAARMNPDWVELINKVDYLFKKEKENEGKGIKEHT